MWSVDGTVSLIHRRREDVFSKPFRYSLKGFLSLGRIKYISNHGEIRTVCYGDFWILFRKAREPLEEYN